MAGTILYCRLCGTGYGSSGEVPIRCPACARETKWTTSPPHTGPSDGALVFTENDRVLLRGFKIDPA